MVLYLSGTPSVSLLPPSGGDAHPSSGLSGVAGVSENCPGDPGVGVTKPRDGSLEEAVMVAVDAGEAGSADGAFTSDTAMSKYTTVNSLVE
jgi:hypothetical protein